MKIGIPRALVFHYYYPFWKVLFEKLGIEVVVSDLTTKELVTRGIKVSVPEICVPIKIFSGHVLDLLDKGVDYVYIPRMISVEKGKYFCPKFLALPDMMVSTIPALEDKLLCTNIWVKDEEIQKKSNYKELIKKLGVSSKLLKQALHSAQNSFDEFRRLSRKGYTIDEATDIVFGKVKEADIPLDFEYDVTIGLIGYVYNIYDEFVSMNIVKKFRELKVRVITFEMFDERALIDEVGKLNKSLFWTFSNRLLGSAYKFYDDKTVDGVMHITAFGCGPDSMVGKYIELEVEDGNKPFMTLRVDEHTGESHLQTRIEAFVEMLRRKKQGFIGSKKEETVHPHGRVKKRLDEKKEWQPEEKTI